eukprot:PITA_08644
MELPLKLVVGIIGNATSLALYLSPMSTFWGIYKFKSTKEYSGLPYVFTLFNCCVGLLYGSPFVKPHSTMILTINSAGFVLETFYLTSFLTFAVPKRKVRTIRLTCALMLAFGLEVGITIFAFHTLHVRQLVVGTVGVVLSIIMYASPFSVVRLVIRTKSVEYMPFLLSLFNFLNAMAWLAYSIVTRDIFIGVPNGIGSVMGMIQLIVYFIYRNSRVVLPASGEFSETKQDDNAILVVVADEKKVVDEKLNVSTVEIVMEGQV